MDGTPDVGMFAQQDQRLMARRVQSPPTGPRSLNLFPWPAYNTRWEPSGDWSALYCSAQRETFNGGREIRTNFHTDIRARRCRSRPLSFGSRPHGRILLSDIARQRLSPTCPLSKQGNLPHAPELLVIPKSLLVSQDLSAAKPRTRTARKHLIDPEA